MIEYLFGNDTLTARRLIADKASAIPATIRWVDAETFEQNESVESILDSSQGSLLGGIVVVFRDPASYSEDVRIKLIEACEKKSGNIIFWDREVDGRSSFHRKIKKLVPTQVFSQPRYEDEMVRWVSSYVQGLTPRISIKKDAIEELVRRVGLDVWSISGEIEKLRVIQGDIDRSHVAQLIPMRHYSYESAFPLLEAIVRKQVVQATAILEAMQQDGATDRFILAMLAYQFRLFLAICVGREQGDSPTVIANKTGLHPVAIQKAIPVASRLSSVMVMDILTKIAAAEKSLTAKGMDGASLVMMLVVSLAR